MKFISSYPRAILHFDGDAFFASIEQSLDYRLKGKPVVTGAERGAATSISYEAKAYGVERGMSLRDIRRICPNVTLVPGNYTAYSIYARRMYSIVRSFTERVEEYSIDECFAEITGLESQFHLSYEDIALLIKARLEEALGITFGVGLAPNKTLAKAASKYRKPAGFTAMPCGELFGYLDDMRIGSIWGLGGVSSLRLQKLGVETAGAFARQPEAFLEANNFPKPVREIWSELQGKYVRTLDTKGDGQIGSIMKTHTFRPTRDRRAIFSELSKNIENACIKARGHKVKAKSFSFCLKTQEFMYYNKSVELPIALADPLVLVRHAEAHFDELYEPGVLYRATGVTLHTLVPEVATIYDLFGMQKETEKILPVLNSIDAVNHRYGRYTLYLGSSSHAVGVRTRDLSSRTGTRVDMDIEQRKKSLDVPYLGIVH